MALFQSPFCSTYSSPAAAQLNSSNGASLDPIADQLGIGLQDYIAGQRSRNRNQPIGRDSSTCTQVVWIFFWLFVLVTLAYPIALLAGLLYALLNPFSLITCAKPLTDFLMGALQLPLTCTQNMIDVKQLIIM